MNPEPPPRKVLVTGGAGFIGSHVVRQLVSRGHTVLNLDKLTYAANRDTLADLAENPRHTLLVADICDAPAVHAAFRKFQPDAVIHLAAESHVDRSIDGPQPFIHSNIVGTATLLEAAAEIARARPGFRFLHVSTDEVYGALGETGRFTEATAYDPHSPYAASKAASDHLVRAWHHTFGLPAIVTHSSNNYGPHQCPEKFVPVVILNALRGLPIPVFGRGENVRDWLHVDDHAEALLAVLERGEIGATYNIGGNHELRNIDLARQLCRIVDEIRPPSAPAAAPRESLITFVADRPGHDHRYAIDATRIRTELGWHPRRAPEPGFRETVRWYLENEAWWQPMLHRLL